jgi:glucose-1-phosphate thymidylyltransferase
MKGIILAGGSGSRLYPTTRVLTKQLQPVYDKPMIYYPLSFLMLGGMRDILMITTAHDLPHFQNLLGDGKNLGINITYKVQEKPTGLPAAFTIGEEFIGKEDVCLILGDNLFYGDFQFFRDALQSHKSRSNGNHAHVFAYSVADASSYGVVEFDRQTKKVKSIEEKPKVPKSHYAIPGLYLFDGTVSERAKKLTPSPRGETEIVDLILSYHKENQLGVEMITRGVAWLDTGTPRSLVDASNYICAIEERQGLKVACLEEVSFRMGFIDASGFQACIEALPKCSYRLYLERLYSELVESK